MPPLKCDGGKEPLSLLKTASLGLAVSFLITPLVYAAGEVPVPTLDRVKIEQTTYLNNVHSTYTLDEITDQ